MKFFF